jgi:hypothetical protein
MRNFFNNLAKWRDEVYEFEPIKEEKIDTEKINNDKKLWKVARNGVIIFCVIHFLFEILTGNNKSLALPVLFNFWMSRWYIQSQISKGKEMKNLLLMGLYVSGVVFLIRLVLGTVLYLFLLQ